MIRKILKSLTLTALLAFAPTMFAATYQYVDTSGTIRTIVADNAEVALANSVNRDSHSGVMIIDNQPVLTGVVLGASTTVPFCSGSNQYDYVNTSGQIMTVTAVSPSVAISTAVNIALHSGVIQACNL